MMSDDVITYAQVDDESFVRLDKILAIEPADRNDHYKTLVVVESIDMKHWQVLSTWEPTAVLDSIITSKHRRVE